MSGPTKGPERPHSAARSRDVCSSLPSHCYHPHIPAYSLPLRTRNFQPSAKCVCLCVCALAQTGVCWGLTKEEWGHNFFPISFSAGDFILPSAQTLKTTSLLASPAVHTRSLKGRVEQLMSFNQGLRFPLLSTAVCSRKGNSIPSRSS